MSREPSFDSTYSEEVFHNKIGINDIARLFDYRFIQLKLTSNLSQMLMSISMLRLIPQIATMINKNKLQFTKRHGTYLSRDALAIGR